jgi:gamma-glutamyltranspeptidase / glutathione hydrolase
MSLLEGSSRQRELESGPAALRPVVRGRRLVVASGHYLGSVAGLRMLERGGNAIDAGVAASFAQLVLEFQSAGLGGECPILIWSAKERRAIAINGNTRSPAAATVRRYRELGFDLIPPDGFLSAGVCATAGALLTALDRFGRLRLADVLEPAIELAADGYPVYDALRLRIASVETRLRTEWPSSAALLLPGGRLPDLDTRLRNPDLARTYERLVEAEHGGRAGGRSAGIRAAIDRFYRGDIARSIVTFQRDTTTTHSGGPSASGLLTEEDFATFATRVEPTLRVDYRGLTVHKCGPWSQGPVFLQQLNLLEGFDLHAMGAGSAELIHTIVECAKLAFADRERYYGDPDFVSVPIAGLLSKDYAARRRALVDPDRAATQVIAGDLASSATPHEPIGSRPWSGGTTGTRAADAEGNLYSATPSGGWLHSSPVIPDLGFALGSRLQQFWLDGSHPDGLAPLKQPRTTLSPTIVIRDGAPYLAFGTPGGDQQDQYTLQFLVNVLDFGMGIQDAADQPAYSSRHFPTSFHPRDARPAQLTIETTVGDAVLEELEARGHVLRRVKPWSAGNVTAVRIAEQFIEGCASVRGRRAYAVGW